MTTIHYYIMISNHEYYFDKHFYLINLIWWVLLNLRKFFFLDHILMNF